MEVDLALLLEGCSASEISKLSPPSHWIDVSCIMYAFVKLLGGTLIRIHSSEIKENRFMDR